MSKNFVHHNSRPRIVIRCTGGANLGRYYNASYYEITSSGQRLSQKQINALFDAGFIGYGQEFNITNRCDGAEEPAGVDIVPCTVEVDGKPTGEAPINPYSGEPYEDWNDPYFVYTTEARVDSSD